MSSTSASLAITTKATVADHAQSTPITEAFDMETAAKMHFITSVWIGTIFFVFGTLGNILSIVIWLRKPLRSSIGTYLIALANVDIGVLFFFFIADSIKTGEELFVCSVFHLHWLSDIFLGCHLQYLDYSWGDC